MPEVPEDQPEVPAENRFPLFEISGGPVAKSMVLTLDGVPMKRVTGFTLDGDVGRVLTLTTRQYVRVSAKIAPGQYLLDTTSVTDAVRQYERVSVPGRISRIKARIQAILRREVPDAEG